MSSFFHNMSIQDHFDQIEKLFIDFQEQKAQIEIMENFFYDMYTNPSRFQWISCPINIYSLHYLQIANNRLFAMNIYTTLESLYTEIIKTFDPTYLKCNVWSIKIHSIWEKNIIKSRAWEAIKKDISRKKLLMNIENSISFDHSTSPSYSIIHSFIEWRWANAHYSLWSTHIDLTSFWVQFTIHKIALINLHEKLLRYLNTLKNPWFSEDFDTFV